MCIWRGKQNMSKSILNIIHVRCTTVGVIYFSRWVKQLKMMRQCIPASYFHPAALELYFFQYCKFIHPQHLFGRAVYSILGCNQNFATISFGETQYVMHHSAPLALLSCCFMCEVPPTVDNKKINLQADNKHTKWLLGGAWNHNHISR